MLVIILLAGLALSAGAQIQAARPLRIRSEAGLQPPVFIDLWNHVAFYDTNLERPRFASILGRFEGKVGLNVFHYPVQVYGVYYGAASQSPDYWDNYIFSGGGVRLIPFRDFQGTSWANEWIKGIKLYYESLAASYLKNAISAEALADTDGRYGLEIWYAWNQSEPDLRMPWGELWLKWENRETNFGWEPFKTWVFYMQPKYGIHLGQGIEAYLKADITMSGKEGADYSFLNIADYGVGLRFVPLRSIGQENDLFRTFKMFAEVLKVQYLKERPINPNNSVESDVRFGVEFSYGR